MLFSQTLVLLMASAVMGAAVFESNHPKLYPKQNCKGKPRIVEADQCIKDGSGKWASYYNPKGEFLAVLLAEGSHNCRGRSIAQSDSGCHNIAEDFSGSILFASPARPSELE
ncbi:hypothetical protein FQN57_002602 [Myotisia sp. PD_48]|nr:hypothetical protein FQN57_002602 [Myotisia sp. PD_48]